MIDEYKLCPYCNDLRKIESVEQEEIIVVRKRDILVLDKFLRCKHCENEFNDPKSDYDVLKEAYLKHNEEYPYDPIVFKDGKAFP